MLKPMVYIVFIIQYTMLFYLDITCEQWFDEMLLEIAIQVIALHNNLKKNRKHQAVSIYKYFPNTCNFILSNAKLIDFKESKLKFYFCQKTFN